MKPIVLIIMILAITPALGYVMLPQPNNITTFRLDPTFSNTGWKNLSYCLYDSINQNVQCLPDSEQNNLVYKRSNLTETTTPYPPKRTPGDTAVFIGSIDRYFKDPTKNEITTIRSYIWKMRYENPR